MRNYRLCGSHLTRKAELTSGGLRNARLALFRASLFSHRRCNLLFDSLRSSQLDLSPAAFTGLVKTTRGMTSDVFSTYFNRDPAHIVLYGSDFGFETVGNSDTYLNVGRSGKVTTKTVSGFELDDKVTFRLLNFDNMLQYEPLTYGRSVWMVVISGDGSQSWKSGSLMGARVTSSVGVKISEHVVGEEREPKPIGGEKISDRLIREYNGRGTMEALPDYDRKDANYRVRSNNIDITKTVVNGHVSMPFESNVVGEVKPISAAIPYNRSDFEKMIEKPTLSIAQLNERHVPLGRWIIRSAVGKDDGAYVCNTDEIYLEQDFYYLSAGSRGEECNVRQLPADFRRKKIVEDGEYNVDRRGVFKIKLADTNPHMSGLSVSDKSVEMLEARAKKSLQSSEKMRTGDKEYAVINTENGEPKPLRGGVDFSKDIRLQLKSQVEAMDDASLKSVIKRQGDMHKFFEENFDNVGPPDDDIIAKISGASSVMHVPSLDGEGSVISKLSYGPSYESRPNSVNFKKKASKYRHASVVDGFDFLPNVFDSTTVGTADDDDMDESDLLDHSFDKLCDSVTVGGTFQKLRQEDEQVFAKLSVEWEKDEAEKRKRASTLSPQRKGSGNSPIDRRSYIGSTRYESPETVASDDDKSLGDSSFASAASGRSLKATRSKLDQMEKEKSNRDLRKQEFLGKTMEKQVSGSEPIRGHFRRRFSSAVSNAIDSVSHSNFFARRRHLVARYAELPNSEHSVKQLTIKTAKSGVP